VIDHFDVCVEDVVYGIDKEVCIFKIREEKQVNKDAQEDTRPAGRFSLSVVDIVSDIEICECREHQNQKKESGCFPVKKEAYEEQECIAQGTLLIDKGVY